MKLLLFFLIIFVFVLTIINLKKPKLTIEVPISKPKKDDAPEEKPLEDHIHCDLKHERLFEFFSIIHSFGGKDPKTKDKEGEKTALKADVGMACVKQWKRPDGRWYYLYVLDFSNVHYAMHKDSEPEQKKGSMNDEKKYDDHFRKFTGFMMSSNGKINKVFHSDKEEPWVTAAKKGAIDQIQMKIDGTKDTRKEKTPLGKVKSHYKFANDESGNTILQKKFNDRDIKQKKIGSKKHKEYKIKSKSLTVLDKNGDISLSIKKEKINLGKHTHKKKKNALSKFFKEKNVPYKKDQSTKADGHTNMKEFTSLKYIKTVPMDPKKYKKYIHPKHVEDEYKNKETHETILPEKKKPKMELKPHYKGDSLKTKGIKEFSQSQTREFIRKSVNFDKQLEEGMKNPKDMALVAQLMDYMKWFDDSMDKVFNKFNEVFKKNPKDLFLRLAQSLILQSKNPKRQEVFLKTWVNDKLIFHGIELAGTVRHPTKILIEKLKEYHKFKQNEKLSTTAFFSLSSIVSKMAEEEQLEVFDIIMKNLKNPELKTHDLMRTLYAIGNIGSRFPLQPLIDIINSDKYLEEVKIVAIKALTRRKKDDDEVNKLIHSIVKFDKFSVKLKIEAIQVQTNRERVIRKGKSLDFFFKYLNSKKVNPVERDEIIKYYIANGSAKAEILLLSTKKAMKLLNKPKTREKLEKAMDKKPKKKYRKNKNLDHILRTNNEFIDNYKFDTFDVYEPNTQGWFRRLFRRIGNAFRRIGRAIGRAFRAVGRAIVRVVRIVVRAVVKVAKFVVKLALAPVKFLVNKVKGVLSKIFGAAEFEGNKICVPASMAPGDQICMYDRKMMDFVQEQGDLSIMTKAKHVEFEKLIGLKQIHMYIGLVAYAGTNINCDPENPPEKLEYVVAARGEMRGKIFKFEMSFLHGEIVSRMRDEYYDRIFFAYLGKTKFDKQLIPGGLDGSCTPKESSMKNEFSPFPRLTFRIVVVFVPVEFSIRVFATTELKFIGKFCQKELRAEFIIQPSVGVGIEGRAGLSILVASAGIQIKASINYSLYPKLEIDAKKCDVCVSLNQKLIPITIEIGAYYNVANGLFSGDFKIFSWSAPAIENQLFKKCISFKGLFKNLVKPEIPKLEEKELKEVKEAEQDTTGEKERIKTLEKELKEKESALKETEQKIGA